MSQAILKAQASMRIADETRTLPPRQKRADPLLSLAMTPKAAKLLEDFKALSILNLVTAIEGGTRPVPLTGVCGYLQHQQTEQRCSQYLPERQQR